jgi:hypothetical protein
MCGCVYRERGCMLSSYASSYVESVNTTMTEVLNAKGNLIHERVSRVIVAPLETYRYGMSPEGGLFCGVVSRRSLFCGVSSRRCFDVLLEEECFFLGSSSAKEQK